MQFSIFQFQEEKKASLLKRKLPDEVLQEYAAESKLSKLSDQGDSTLIDDRLGGGSEDEEEEENTNMTQDYIPLSSS